MLSITLLIFSLFQTDTITVYTQIPIDKGLSYEFMSLLEKTYNRKHQDKIELKFQGLKNFKAAFDLLEDNRENDYICYINNVTITIERKKKFDFSYPYFPVRPAAITAKDSPLNISNIYDKKYKVGAIKSTINFKYAEEIVKKTNQKFVSIAEYDNLNLIFKRGDIDFYIGDAISPWLRDDIKLLHIYKEIGEGGYGILYPKGSKLKKRFDNTIKYLLSSSIYFSTVKKAIPRIDFRYFRRVKD